MLTIFQTDYSLLRIHAAWISSSGNICVDNDDKTVHVYPICMSTDSLVPRLFEGRRKGLVHTECACARGSRTGLKGRLLTEHSRANTGSL